MPTQEFIYRTRKYLGLAGLYGAAACTVYTSPLWAAGLMSLAFAGAACEGLLGKNGMNAGIAARNTWNREKAPKDIQDAAVRLAERAEVEAPRVFHGKDTRIAMVDQAHGIEISPGFFEVKFVKEPFKTEGLMQDAVLAHEVAHIKNKDMELGTFNAYACRIMACSLFFWPFMDWKQSLLHLALIPVAFAADKYVDRQKEFLADIGSGKLLGSALPMLALITKLAANENKKPVSFDDTFGARLAQKFERLMDDHPRDSKRAVNLKKLQFELDEAGIKFKPVRRHLSLVS